MGLWHSLCFVKNLVCFKILDKSLYLEMQPYLSRLLRIPAMSRK